MEKFMPLKGNIGKGFRNVAITLALVFFLLWFIQSEAERVHTELYLTDTNHDNRLKVLEGIVTCPEIMYFPSQEAIEVYIKENNCK